MNTTQQYLVEEELEHLRDGWISRREFMRRAVLLGASAGTAAAMAACVMPAATSPAQVTPAQASPATVPDADPAVSTDWIFYRSTDGQLMKAYVAWPAGGEMAMSLPGVAVCHENRGLTPHIQDVARRFAQQSYVAIAPDLVSRTGTPTDEMPSDDALTAAFRTLDPVQNAMDFVAAVDVLRAHPSVDETKLAATGYCFGGGVTWQLATISPYLKAVAPFYGSNPPIEDVPNIRAAVFGVYGELDQRINAGIPAIEAALQQAGTTYQLKIYPNSNHAFHNDTGQNYNPETAAQARSDTLNWFAQHLGLGPQK